MYSTTHVMQDIYIYTIYLIKLQLATVILPHVGI